MVPFVQNILKNAIMGVVAELSGFSENSEIEVKFNNKSDTAGVALYFCIEMEVDDTHLRQALLPGVLKSFSYGE